MTPARCLIAVFLLAAVQPARAADKSVTIALDFSLTGADAASANRMKNGGLLAIDQANDGTPTAGQYDAGQAATNARKMVSDPAVVAAIGPHMSGAAKAMLPILNEAGLPMISPATSSPDLTAVRFADEYRASGRLTFFRTIASDAYQAPGMANYFAETLHLKTVYVLDDTGAYGVGIANTFSAEAVRKGMKVLGRDKVDPKAEDYSAVMTKIKALNPDALYYGGVFEAGVKVIKQSYDAVPHAAKAGGDGLYGPEILTAAGFPAAQGWYITAGAPHVLNDPKMAKFVADYKAKFGISPDDYSVTCYDAATVLLAAIKSVADAGKPITRDTIRAAIERSTTATLQGPVQFDANGDLKNKIISIFQVKQDPSKPDDDMDAQLRYVGVAPQS
jgi:branched-chain amino acid transport system substrate-binding protein